MSRLRARDFDRTIQRRREPDMDATVRRLPRADMARTVKRAIDVKRAFAVEEPTKPRVAAGCGAVAEEAEDLVLELDVDLSEL